jgi:solute:Na+ symporter, SSS family
MPFYLLYIVLLLIISILYSRGWKNQILTLSKGSSWIITGISLFMLYLSADQGQLLFEVIQKHGIWGLWQYSSAMVGAFIIPLIFAPFWQRLQLVSDNDFIVFRFSGAGARILQLFRAYYVGMLIVMLLLSFHVLAFSKLLSAFFDIDKNESLLITGLCLFIFSLKNCFSIKLKTDLLHAVFYLIALIILGIFVYDYSDGLFHAFSNLKQNQPELLAIWPQNNDQWFYSLAFLSVQWWSLQIFDGGGPEMIRFKSAESEKGAVYTGMSSTFLTLFSGFITILLVLMIFSVSNQETTDFNHAIKTIVPEYLHPLIVLGWFGLFITTCESLLLWGVGFWSLDLYQRIKGKQNETASPFFLLGSMFFLSLMAITAAYFAENLQSIMYWFFALSAGVAPIFILRWFWMRINAWTQLTAMASVPFLNLLYNFFDFSKVLPFHESEMGAYVWRMLILTPATLLLSFVVMYLTPADDPEKIKIFKERIPGFAKIRNRFVLAILLGFAYFILWNLLWTWIVG